MCKGHRVLRGRVQRAGPQTGAVTLVQPGREGPGLWTMRKAPETAFLAPLGRGGLGERSGSSERKASSLILQRIAKAQ